MTYYRIFEETRISEGTEYEAYGVAAFNESGELVAVVPDITSVREKAHSLAQLCERHNLSPCHLNDVAEDFIISDRY